MLDEALRPDLRHDLVGTANPAPYVLHAAVLV
jgi:hypothetical protein